MACQYQKLEVLKFLLHTEGVDCQACTKQSMTGLHYAAIHDSAEMAQLLIGKNCPLHIQDEEVCTYYLYTRSHVFLITYSGSKVYSMQTPHHHLRAKFPPQGYYQY